MQRNITFDLIGHAQARPDAAALLLPHRTIVFRELDQKVWQYAAALHAQGVRAGQVVGLSFVEELGLVLTLFFGWIFVWYCYVFSSELPGAELALDVGAAVPSVSLLDERGQTVDLEPLARGKLVLVFFRGHW